MAGRFQDDNLIPLVGSKPPDDVGNLAYLLFFLLGATILFPWNSFISAVDYFTYLYPDTHVDRVFAVAYMAPCLLVLGYLSFRGDYHTTKARVNLGFVLYLAALVLVPVMDAFIISEGGANAFTHYATVGALIVTGIADALVQGNIIGAAGELPERYMQAFVAGTAACAVLVNMLRIVTKAAYPYDERGLRASSNLFFLVSGCFMALSVVAYNFSHRLPILAYYRDLKRAAIEDTQADCETSNGHKDTQSPVKLKHEVQFGLNPETTAYVLARIPWLAGGMVITYIITLSIFPGFITEDVHSAVLGDWYPILLISAFNLFDLVGKSATAVYLVSSPGTIAKGTFSRLVFFPLFYAILHGPKALRKEVSVTLLTSLLGLTNGYASSCLLIVAPKVVPYAAAESAGMVMTLALVLGLFLGSLVSFFWII